MSTLRKTNLISRAHEIVMPPDYTPHAERDPRNIELSNNLWVHLIRELERLESWRDDEPDSYYMKILITSGQAFMLDDIQAHELPELDVTF